jgi:DNA topoisomerase-1
MPPYKYKSKKILLIVESYTKSNKIDTFLDHKYICFPTLGHFREIDTDYQKQIFETFKPVYKVMSYKKKLVDELRSQIRDSTHVIIATDDDREGEAIAWHICDTFKLDPLTTKRIIFHEVTKEAIMKAILNPTTINMNIVKSQQTRQIIDLFIGFKVSPVIWKNVIKNKTLSAGRCQTPALNIVYDNHIKHMNMKKEQNGNNYRYDVSATFTSYNILFHLNNSFQSEEDMIDFLNKTKNFQHMYDIKIPEEYVVEPPLPYSTVDILKVSPYSTIETMNICQSLYEEGLITYHRTDSRKISSVATRTISSYIDSVFGENYVRNYMRYMGWDKDETMDCAHEAIRPVDIWTKEAGATPKEKKIYTMIWNRTIESCMTDYKYIDQEVVITAPDNHMYSFVSNQTVFDGWKKVQGISKDISNLMTPNINCLKNFSKSKLILWNRVYCNMEYICNTNYLSENNLVSILEEKGIGRPSTYASIVNKIQEKGYVKRMNIEGKEKIFTNMDMDNDCIINREQLTKIVGKKKNKLIIQDTGIKIVQYLYDKFYHIFDYGYTRKMEIELDKISCGEGDSDGKEMYMECYNCVNKIIEGL